MVTNIYILGKDGKTGLAIQKRLANESEYKVVEKIEDCDLIVTSPGVPPTQYPSTNKKIISEIELAYRLNPSPVIAITGTNAKSTTTQMIAEMLNIPAIGNIGTPYISEKAEYNYLSVEVSSYQLYTIKNFCPHIAIILNITPDHLKWHGSMEAYIKAKGNIFKNQTASDYLIYNSDDSLVCKLVKSAKSQLIPFSARNKLSQSREAAKKVWEIVNPKEIPDFDKFSDNFTGLAHRFEKVGVFENKTIINDSKATNPEATAAALESFPDNSPLTIILGGQDKGTSLTELTKLLNEKANSIILTGACASKFNQEIDHQNKKIVTDFFEAIEKAIEVTATGGIILLSPAAASFDCFSSFEERGDKFKEKIHDYFQTR